MISNLERPIPNTDFCMNDYMQGRCHIFALALHLELGYQIEMMWDDNRIYFFEPNGKGLEHAYCVKDDGDLVDIRGIFTKVWLEENWFCNKRRYEKYTLELLEKDFSNDFLEPPTENEIKSLRDFIRHNNY